MSLNEILIAIAYGVVAVFVIFAFSVFYSIYTPKPKVKKDKTSEKKKRQSKKAPQQEAVKVVKKGKEQVAVTDEGDSISLGGSVSERN
jgi:large-conductance mechanosensitive channel